ncbi:MAG: GntR family transcriptional regulator [Methyloligellaceae bacterium]
MAELRIIPNETPKDPSGVKARERYGRIHVELRRRICLLDYPPGVRLSEEALAREFGTSRTPVRQVLARLEGEGLVKSVHGVGTFVTDANIDELEQAYRLRVELVGLTCALSPKVPDAAFLKEFRALRIRSKEMLKTGTPRAFTQLDMDMFETLIRLTGNEPLREIRERLYYRTKRIWIKSAVAAELDLNEEYYMFDRELEDILSALEIGDMEALGNIQKAHISMSFQRLLKASTGTTRP